VSPSRSARRTRRSDGEGADRSAGTGPTSPLTSPQLHRKPDFTSPHFPADFPADASSGVPREVVVRRFFRGGGRPVVAAGWAARMSWNIPAVDQGAGETGIPLVAGREPQSSSSTPTRIGMGQRPGSRGRRHGGDDGVAARSRRVCVPALPEGLTSAESRPNGRHGSVAKARPRRWRRQIAGQGPSHASLRGHFVIANENVFEIDLMFDGADVSRLTKALCILYPTRAASFGI